ncbi:MAG: 7-carboxy-7-deazaguanine synthase QueE [Pseudomonadota bacterium]
MINNKEQRLRITEIFYSLQGETSLMGLPTVFIRLTGCPLRCHYCDTAYAFSGGKPCLIDDIVKEVSQYHTKHITVTGGEPLAQPNCLVLLSRLCDLDYTVSLETSGALSVARVDPRVIKIIDVKTPASGEVKKNDWSNFDHLNQHDEIKFVICDYDDYCWSKTILDDYNLRDKAVLFSPSCEQLPAQKLADWILADQLPVRMQIQLHKYLWGNVKGK